MIDARAKNYAIALAALCVAALALIAAWRISALLEEARLTIAEARQTIEVIRPEVYQVARQAKFVVFEAQAGAKAFRSEWESPDYLRNRRTALAAGQQATALLARLNAETLPRLNNVIIESGALVARTNLTLNDSLMPQITRLAEQTATSERELTDALTAAIRSGQADAERISKAVDLALSDPEIKRALKGVADLSEQSAATMTNVSATTAHFPPMAATARKYQKPLLIARFLALIADIFY